MTVYDKYNGPLEPGDYVRQKERGGYRYGRIVYLREPDKILVNWKVKYSWLTSWIKCDSVILWTKDIPEPE